jgi:hypothetical protein
MRLSHELACTKARRTICQWFWKDDLESKWSLRACLFFVLASELGMSMWMPLGLAVDFSCAQSRVSQGGAISKDNEIAILDLVGNGLLVVDVGW